MMKSLRHKFNVAALALGCLAAGAALSGCQSQETTLPAPSATSHDAAVTPTAASGTPSWLLKDAATVPPDNSNTLVLREGDTITITFPGAPSLNTTQTIRRDGKVNMEMLGEITAAGQTPHDLELQLLKSYDNQLVVKEVSVMVQTATFIVYVAGAVTRPGKIISNRVETPLEAIIEAGYDSTRSNLKRVVVIRENEDGKTERFKLNLDNVMKGKATTPFTLKPQDKIIVAEKFTWY